MISQHADLVQRFGNAYMHAFADVLANPNEAAESILEAKVDAPPKDVLVRQIKADIEHSFLSATTKANGLGWMAESQWKETARVLKEEGLLKRPLEVAQAFNASFLKNAKPEKS